MKRIIAIVLLIMMLTTFCSCGKAKGYEIPDVFGVNYLDAVEVLEADGFEVKVIETSVSGISEKLLYPLESVSKGTVFKIDDYIIDNNGYINKNYDIVYDEGLISEDKSIVIYYAKEDYVFENKQAGNNDATVSDDTTTTSSEQNVTSQQPEIEEKDTGIDPDFKTAIDSYEKFMNDYVEFMKKYKANPSDLSLIADYTTFISDYADYVEDFEAWEDEDLNADELAYYLDVQTRVSKKLLEIAQ